MTRPMRADARRNQARLVAAARAAFAEQGADVPLEDVARRAGVGIGTLYRHFPERTALIAAVFSGEVDALVELAGELDRTGAGLPALTTWLRALIDSIRAYGGLCRTLLAEGRPGAGPVEAMEAARTRLQTAGDLLLRRARQHGEVRADIRVQDLLHLGYAIALAAGACPEDPRLADRVLALAVHGLSTAPARR